MIVRIFDTTVDPGDVDLGIQLFRDEVLPVFEAFDGCHGIEMLISADEHSGDLVQIAAVSRWSSIEAIEAATQTDNYAKALSNLRKLFVHSPIIRHFNSID